MHALDPSGTEDPLAIRDQLAILALEGRYAVTWDTVDAEGWAGLFSDDGVFEMVGVGSRPNTRIEGREQLIAFCQEINGQLEGLHMMHVPAVTIEGDGAHGWMNFQFCYRDRNGEQGDVSGVYQVDYVREAEGWRIKHRLEKVVFRNRASGYGIPPRVHG